MHKLALLALSVAVGCAALPPAPAGPTARGPARARPPAEEAQPLPRTRTVSAESPEVTRREPPAEPVRPAAAAARQFTLPLAPRAETRAVVLLYHAFNRGNVPLSVRTRDFDAQLTWLEQHEVEIVTTTELLDFLDGRIALPARVALITIDDGFSSVYTQAWPVLAKHKARFTLGLPTGMLESPKNAPVMNWAQVRELLDSGLCEIASHGHMHRRLAGMSGRLLKEELELSRQLIEERLGVTPVAYFYPLGAYDRSSAKAVQQAGYRGAFRATGAPIAASAGPMFWLPRVSIFHGESAGMLSNYYGARFLAQVSYDARRDPARGRD